MFELKRVNMRLSQFRAQEAWFKDGEAVAKFRGLKVREAMLDLSSKELAVMRLLHGIQADHLRTPQNVARATGMKIEEVLDLKSSAEHKLFNNGIGKVRHKLFE